MTTFDFEDGKGAVPAHRHRNPDRFEGGWVADTAIVTKTAFLGSGARVFGQAQVCGSAKVWGAAQVFGSACVYGQAQVFGSSQVFGEAHVFGSAQVFGAAQVQGNVLIYGSAQVSDSSQVYENARVGGSAQVFDQTQVFTDARVMGHTTLHGETRVSNASLYLGTYTDINCNQTPRVILLDASKTAIILESRILIEDAHKTLEEWDQDPPPHWDQLRPHIMLMLLESPQSTSREADDHV